MYPTIETFSWVDTALRTLFPSQVLPQIVHLDYFRLSDCQIVHLDYLRVQPVSHFHHLENLSKMLGLRQKVGPPPLHATNIIGWHFPWVSMYPRTKMTPQHMFMILWFSNNWGFNLIIKPTFRQGFPFLSLTPLEEKSCNWNLFKSCHAFVWLAP